VATLGSFPGDATGWIRKGWS